MVPLVEIVQDRLGLEGHARRHAGSSRSARRRTAPPELDPADVADMTEYSIAESGWSEVGLDSLLIVGMIWGSSPW